MFGVAAWQIANWAGVIVEYLLYTTQETLCQWGFYTGTKPIGNLILANTQLCRGRINRGDDLFQFLLYHDGILAGNHAPIQLNKAAIGYRVSRTAALNHPYIASW